MSVSAQESADGGTVVVRFVEARDPGGRTFADEELEVSVLAIDANGTTLTCSPPPVDLAGARTAAV